MIISQSHKCADNIFFIYCSTSTFSLLPTSTSNSQMSVPRITSRSSQKMVQWNIAEMKLPNRKSTTDQSQYTSTATAMSLDQGSAWISPSVVLRHNIDRLLFIDFPVLLLLIWHVPTALICHFLQRDGKLSLVSSHGVILYNHIIFCLSIVVAELRWYLKLINY